MRDNPVWLQSGYCNVLGNMSGSLLLLVCRLFLLFPQPVSITGMFFLLPGNHWHAGKDLLPKLLPMLHSQNHVLLRSSVFPLKYLLLHQKMPIRSVHDYFFSSLYPYPYEALLLVEILCIMQLPLSGFQDRMFQYMGFHTLDKPSTSAVHIRNNGSAVFHLCDMS